MQSFIQKHAILSSCQYGFRELHSTKHANLDIVNTVQSNMAKKLFCVEYLLIKKKLLIQFIIKLFYKNYVITDLEEKFMTGLVHI